HLGEGPFAEEVIAKLVLVEFDGVREFLVLGQIANQIRNRRHVGGSRGPDHFGASFRETRNSSKSAACCGVRSAISPFGISDVRESENDCTSAAGIRSSLPSAPFKTISFS